VQDHLKTNHGDWQGASDALGREAVSAVDDLTSLFTPPQGKQWFARRTATNAEALIRGDLPLTRETFDPHEVCECPVTLRFAHGTASLPVFGEIARSLARLRNESPDVLHGASHGIFYHPDVAAEYLERRGFAHSH
jgi:hypothetical protein